MIMVGWVQMNLFQEFRSLVTSADLENKSCLGSVKVEIWPIRFNIRGLISPFKEPRQIALQNDARDLNFSNDVCSRSMRSPKDEILENGSFWLSYNNMIFMKKTWFSKFDIWLILWYEGQFFSRYSYSEIFQFKISETKAFSSLFLFITGSSFFVSSLTMGIYSLIYWEGT